MPIRDGHFFIWVKARQRTEPCAVLPRKTRLLCTRPLKQPPRIRGNSVRAGRPSGLRRERTVLSVIGDAHHG